MLYEVGSKVHPDSISSYCRLSLKVQKYKHFQSYSLDQARTANQERTPRSSTNDHDKPLIASGNSFCRVAKLQYLFLLSINLCSHKKDFFFRQLSKIVDLTIN